MLHERLIEHAGSQVGRQDHVGGPPGAEATLFDAQRRLLESFVMQWPTIGQCKEQRGAPCRSQPALLQ